MIGNGSDCESATEREPVNGGIARGTDTAGRPAVATGVEGRGITGAAAGISRTEIAAGIVIATEIDIERSKDIKNAHLNLLSTDFLTQRQMIVY